MYFVRSESVKEKTVGEDLALYVEQRRSIHVLNSTARFIWESLKEPLTFDELLFMLTESFPVEPDVLRDDLRKTLDRFKELDVVLTRPTRDDDAVS
jgi:hypothetical protein